eukprot:6466524-Amphidinium_carterae.1
MVGTCLTACKARDKHVPGTPSAVCWETKFCMLSTTCCGVAYRCKALAAMQKAFTWLDLQRGVTICRHPLRFCASSLSVCRWFCAGEEIKQ